MNILQNIIGSMNKEEIRNYKLFTNRTSAGGDDRKDVLLFDYMRKSFPDYDEAFFQKKVYKVDDKNALYRLKNRLLEDLGKSLSVQYYGHNEINYIFNNIILAKLFLHKGNPHLSSYYLSKAEKKTNEIESFELLELIYMEFIKLSHETLEVNPEEYIIKRKENRVKLNQLQEIDEILAAVTYRLKISQNFSKQNNKILEVLQTTVNEYSNTKNINKNPQLRFKIYHAVSRILLQKHDYIALEKYLLITFGDFSRKALFNKNNHETKLQMLTYLINSLFKNNKIELSLQYTEKLKMAMEEYSKLNFDQYLFYYYNSLVINYSKVNLNKAIEILEEMKENRTISKLPASNAFIYLNLSVLNFEKKEFKLSLKALVRLNMHESFKNLDEVFRYKIAVMELIIRFEMEDFDFIEHKTTQIKKEFSSLYLNPEYQRVKEMIDLIVGMCNSPRIKQNNELLTKINKLIGSMTSKEAAENDIINYHDWLKSKI